MAYRETRLRCATCGRVTVHWRPRMDLRPPGHSENASFSMGSLIRALQRRLSSPWRCLDCDHPWKTSLLRRPPDAAGTGRPTELQRDKDVFR
jgi:hypothetical protein